MSIQYEPIDIGELPHNGRGPVIERTPELDALPRPTRLGDVATDQPMGETVQGLIVRDEINGLVGEGGSGKTTDIAHVAAAVACGQPVYDARTSEQTGVLIVSGEDSAAVIRNRIDAFCAGHGWDAAVAHDRIYILDDKVEVDLDDPRWIEHLIQCNGDLRLGLNFHDPLVDLCGQGVKENDNSDAKRVTRALRRLMRQSGATQVLSMHVAKPGEQRAERQHRIRGASAWKNATRKCWWVEAQDAGFELEDIKRNRSTQSSLIRLRLIVESEPANELMWTKARLELDTDQAVVSADVIDILRFVAGCSDQPTSNDIYEATNDHRVSKHRAEAAVSTARVRGWLQFTPGPNRSKLWAITEAGKVRMHLGASR